MFKFGIPTGGAGHGILTFGLSTGVVVGILAVVVAELVAELVDTEELAEVDSAALTSMEPNAATMKVAVSFMLIVVG